MRGDRRVVVRGMMIRLGMSLVGVKGGRTSVGRKSRLGGLVRLKKVMGG